MWLLEKLRRSHDRTTHQPNTQYTEKLKQLNKNTALTRIGSPRHDTITHIYKHEFTTQHHEHKYVVLYNNGTTATITPQQNTCTCSDCTTTHNTNRTNARTCDTLNLIKRLHATH